MIPVKVLNPLRAPVRVWDPPADRPEPMGPGSILRKIKALVGWSSQQLAKRLFAQSFLGKILWFQTETYTRIRTFQLNGGCQREQKIKKLTTEVSKTPKQKERCRFCGNTYSDRSGVNRHEKKFCTAPGAPNHQCSDACEDSCPGAQEYTAQPDRRTGSKTGSGAKRGPKPKGGKK